ncbi:hypothetical protein OG607_16715 [Streptomyces sp. NBC_01537]|uniref:hypothetical protein n=1 Tax=Streptomyces sp. NBC_01537 TaxID=2903896 RepID=UPI003870ED33
MGFDVQPDDLDSYASQVGRAAEDFQHTRRYAQQHGNVAVSNDGLFGLIAGAHSGVLERVSAEIEGFRVGVGGLDRVRDVVDGGEGRAGASITRRIL